MLESTQGDLAPMTSFVDGSRFRAREADGIS